MVKSKQESVTEKVEAATASTKKSKRDAEVDVDIQKNPKKQKEELIEAEKKTPPKKKNKKKKATKISEQEKVTPEKKKDTNVEMVEAEQKSNAKQPNTLFAGHLPFHIEKSDLESFFKEVGEIVDVRLARGFAHVEFASVEAAQKALKLNGKPLLGRNIKLGYANKKPPPRNQVKTIFVTKFHQSAGEHEMKTALKNHFSACGEIKRISIPCYQDTGASKGMAYLDFNEDGFNKALELNGSELGGRNIVVIEATPLANNADDDDRRTPSKSSVLVSA